MINKKFKILHLTVIVKLFDNSWWVSWIVAREKNRVLLLFDVAMNAQTLLFLRAESWYVSMPQIIKLLSGMFVCHNSPPNLQFICIATLVITLFLFLSSSIICDVITWLGTGFSMQHILFMASYLSLRFDVTMHTTIWDLFVTCCFKALIIDSGMSSLIATLFNNNKNKYIKKINVWIRIFLKLTL